MVGRTTRLLIVVDSIIAFYLAVGIIFQIGIQGIIAWPFIFLAWAAVFRLIVFLGESPEEIIYETDGSEEGESQANKPGPKDRRISSEEPDSKSFRNVSRIIGEVAQREYIHSEENEQRSENKSSSRERQANRDFADFLRSS